MIRYQRSCTTTLSQFDDVIKCTFVLPCPRSTFLNFEGILQLLELKNHQILPSVSFFVIIPGDSTRLQSSKLHNLAPWNAILHSPDMPDARNPHCICILRSFSVRWCIDQHVVLTMIEFRRRCRHVSFCSLLISKHMQLVSLWCDMTLFI